MSEFLLTADYVVESSESEPQSGWGVLIQGSEIVEVGLASPLRAAHPQVEEIPFSGRLLAPGFINTHHHMYGVLSHGIPLDKAPSGFWPFLEDFWWPLVEDALSHEMIAAATELACLEMVRSGITTFYDCLEAPNALPGALDVEAEIVRRWGLRGFLSFEATERQGEQNGQLGHRENAGFIDRARKAGGLVQGLMCYHTTFTCSESFIRQAFALAEERNVRVHAHVSEGTYEPEFCLKHFGRRTLEQYQHWRLLGPQLLASQCVQIDSHEIRLLAESGANVVHMPLSNCEVGGGFSPVPEMLQAGIPIALGSDGYINNFLEVMRGAFLMHKARLQDPTVMPADTIWKMATENGARALGLRKVGRLAPGFSADLLTIDLDLPTPPQSFNLRDQVLLWRNPEHIREVMVAGRFLMRDGVVIGVDEDAIRAHCREAARELWEL